MAEVPPETGLVAAASWALWKILGPAAEEFADAARRWAAYRTRNIGRVLEMAAEEAGADLEQSGEVHPRVAHRLIEEGSYCDDDVMQRYLAGMLRASRTPDGTDDRAAYYVNLVASLPANHVRLHHAIYSAVAEHPRPTALLIGDLSQYEELTVKASVESAASILSVRAGEDPEDVVTDTVHGLIREGLLYGRRYVVGGVDEFRRVGASVSEPSMFVRPNAVGALLYLWGRGVATSDAERLGRVQLRALDPPGPVLAGVRVEPWPEPWKPRS